MLCPCGGDSLGGGRGGIWNGEIEDFDMALKCTFLLDKTGEIVSELDFNIFWS